MQVLATIDDVLKELGGTSAVAEILNVSPQTVSEWRKHPRLPARTYVAFKAVLQQRGFDAPIELWGMKSPPAPLHMDAST